MDSRPAGAHRIAFDMDLSGATNAIEDRALAGAMERMTAEIILPVFERDIDPAGSGQAGTIAIPHLPFVIGSSLATAAVPVEKDGLSRRYAAGAHFHGLYVQSLGRLLSAERTSTRTRFYVDYGIDPESVPRLSYIDVLDGNHSPHALRGKSVIIGAMAPALGDRLSVPVHGSLPGPLVHALAYESLQQDRHVFARASLIIVLAAFLFFYGGARLLARRGRLAGAVAP